MTLHDKSRREGIRVSLDPAKLEAWPEIKSWFFKLKPKEEQDHQLLLEQIKEAGASICSLKHVTVALHLLRKQHRAEFALCPHCKESYPIADGERCIGCQGGAPYLDI